MGVKTPAAWILTGDFTSQPSVERLPMQQALGKDFPQVFVEVSLTLHTARY